MLLGIWKTLFNLFATLHAFLLKIWAMLCSFQSNVEMIESNKKVFREFCGMHAPSIENFFFLLV